MASNEELLKAVSDLKAEVRELRGMVHLLLNIISEAEIEFEDDPDQMDIFRRIGGSNSQFYIDN